MRQNICKTGPNCSWHQDISISSLSVLTLYNHKISSTTLTHQNHCNNQPKPFTSASNELDSHADTCVLGPNFIVTHYTQRTCSVQAFSDSFSPINNIPIVQGATAYDCPHTGQTYILLINEGLYFGTSMNHSLINPNQLRHFGTIVQDNPYSKDNITYIEANVPDNEKRLHILLTSNGINIL